MGIPRRARHKISLPFTGTCVTYLLGIAAVGFNALFGEKSNGESVAIDVEGVAVISGSPGLDQ